MSSRARRRGWASDPIFNRIMNERRSRRPCEPLEQDPWYVELTRVNEAAALAGPVDFHRMHLGRQSYTWNGSDARMWVWETDAWRAYVSNSKGVCFEVRWDLSDEDAFAAFEDYLRKLKLR